MAQIGLILSSFDAWSQLPIKWKALVSKVCSEKDLDTNSYVVEPEQ